MMIINKNVDRLDSMNDEIIPVDPMKKIVRIKRIVTFATLPITTPSSAS